MELYRKYIIIIFLLIERLIFQMLTTVNVYIQDRVAIFVNYLDLNV